MIPSQHYKIVTGKDLIFGQNGSMKLYIQKMSFASSIYTVPIILSKLDKGKWIKIGELDLKYIQNEIQSFGEIQNFQFKVIDISVADNGKMIIEIEINELNNNNDLKCIVCPLSAAIGYFDGKTLHHFCSQKCLLKLETKKKRKLEIVGEENPNKKVKINEIKELDILMIGLDHAEKEDILKLHLKECLNEFSTEFNSIEINNKKRKPFLIFWESLRKEDDIESIQLSQIDGRGTESWFLPKENDVIGSFTFMQTSFEGFLYPVNYDSNGDPDDIKNDKIQRRIGNSHGDHGEMDILIKSYGHLSPIALRSAWEFAYEFLRYLLMNNNINNTSFLELFIPDKELIKELIKELRELWISCMSVHREFLKTEIVSIIFSSLKDGMIIDNIDEFKQLQKKIFEEKFPKDDNELFTKESHISLLKLIKSNKLSFLKNADAMKIFIRKYWLKIGSLVNTKNVTYPLKLDLKITLNYARNFNPVINQDFFFKLTEELKSNIAIDIPTLLYSIFMDNVLENKRPESDYIDLTVKVRDYIGVQTMIDICTFTNITRCVFIQGAFHNETLEEILLNDSSEIQYNIKKYSVIRDINSQGFNFEGVELYPGYEKFKKLLYLYFMLEKIDEWLWLWETSSILKKTITVPSYYGKELHKLQYYTRLYEYHKTPSTDSLEADFKYYIGLVMSTNHPEYLHGNNIMYFKEDKALVFSHSYIVQRTNGSPFKHTIHYTTKGKTKKNKNLTFNMFIHLIRTYSRDRDISIVKIE